MKSKIVNRKSSILLDLRLSKGSGQQGMFHPPSACLSATTDNGQRTTDD
jgi:hypothetical protein